MQVSDRALGILHDLRPRTQSARAFGQSAVEGVREARSEADSYRASPPAAQVMEGEWLRRVTTATGRGGPSHDVSSSSQAARGAAFYRALSEIATDTDHTLRDRRLDVYA